MKPDRKICVGMIAGTHGVRGLVRLRSFMEDPTAIASFKPLTDEEGSHSFTVHIKSAAKDYFVAAIDGVDSKEAADVLRGTKLYVARSLLPKTRKQEYYETDLLGLAAKDAQGVSVGSVLAVHNYGGGPFLEIGKSKTDSFMLPFTKECVPQVDIDRAVVVVHVPDGWLKPEEQE